MSEQDEKKSIELVIRDQLDINEQDILGELRRQSAHFFYWGAMWSKAAKARRKQRLKLKETEARLSNHLRQQISEVDPKARVTEAMKTDFLYQHPEYLEVEKEMIECEYREDILDIAREGFKQRAQALQELARQEREASIYGDEFAAMKKEYDAREEDKKPPTLIRKGVRRHKRDPEKQQEPSNE